MNPKYEYEIYGKIHGYLKLYPHHAKLIQYDIPVERRISGYELVDSYPKSGKLQKKGVNPVALIDSIRRTKRVISDITLCNEFDMFATFTFAKDRQNVESLKKRMSKWLKNQREIHGKFTYLIVPEFHKDGKSIHFHALMKNYKGHLIPAVTPTGRKIFHKNKQVYNIKSYKHGFSTITHIKDVNKTASYVRKYITKDMPLFKGKKRYWCSNDLIRPKLYPDPIIDPWTIETFSPVYKRNNLIISESTAIIPEPIIINKGDIPIWQM